MGTGDGEFRPRERAPALVAGSRTSRGTNCRWWPRLLGQTEKALAWLERSVDTGWACWPFSGSIHTSKTSAKYRLSHD
jgi:hypothetical protein